MNKLTVPLYRAISIRHVSLSNMEKNVCWPKPDYGPMEVQRSVLLNGMKIAAAKCMGAQIGACTIMYQAGSRYEVDDQLGATHFYRAASTMSGCGYSSFYKMRYLPQLGANITCSTDRQTIAYTLRCPLSCFSELKYCLLDVAARCCYNEWEINDRRQFIKDDLVRIHPEQRILDLIQRACWRGPLYNSVFCEEEIVDSMSENTLNCFAKANLRSDTCTVASVGLPFEETMKLAEKIEYSREKPPERSEVCSFPRAGFETYDLGPGSDTWIAVAVPGCGTYDVSCLIKHAIVAAACGTGNVVTGQHATDRALQSPLGVIANEDIFTSFRAFNISYRETGLFGILAKTRACSARSVALAAAEFLANVENLNFNQIDIGKQRLKLGVALHDEDCVKVAEGLALQLANNVQIDSAKNSICIIDTICPDEISCTAKLLSRKSPLMAYAVVGDVGAVPHDGELLHG